MSDGWTDKKRRSICNFLVNSPKGTFFLYSLDTSDISKTTDKVVKMLEDAVEFVGEENVVQIVTDNAANYKAAGERMMETRKSLYWTPCAAHCIDLILDLRLVDSDEKPAMGFIFEGMKNAKETIRTNFGCVKKSYEPIWEIINGRWKSQLHRPLHAAAYYLNPHYHYEPNFMVDDADIKIGLYSCLKKLVPNQEERKKVGLQLPDFHYARGLFGNETAKSSRKTMLPAEWWNFYGDSCPELKKFAIRVLSLTCSSSGCERNWSAFEMVHTKRRNRLHQKKINDLVYVMYNLKLKGKQIRKTPELEFDAVHSDDEWITEDVNENIAESVEHSHLPTNDNTNDDPNSNEFAIPDFVGRVEPEAERNDVSDEDDDVDAMEDEDIGGFEF
ncbi:uncharacterized protein LOC107620063 [Arachis ipaensis]|uniref:uncharacterized protein LOC107620063 n=1 Tax=Arachis ipaensis TaxID=130454 RepID=UPI0007AF1777|nr:uncharacterized protein LOC107620063 [Arachis ipaensis]